MLRVYRASGDCLEIPLAAWRSTTDHSDSAFLPPSRSRTSTSRIEPPEVGPTPSSPSTRRARPTGVEPAPGSQAQTFFTNDLDAAQEQDDADETPHPTLVEGELSHRMRNAQDEEQRRRDGNPIVVGETDSPSASPTRPARNLRSRDVLAEDLVRPAASTRQQLEGKMPVVPVLQCSRSASPSSTRHPGISSATFGAATASSATASSSSTSTAHRCSPQLQEGHDLPPDDPHEEDAAVPPAIPVSEAREIVARYLSRIQGCNVPSTLCFLVHNDPEDCEKFGEVMHDDELVAVLPFSTGEEPHQEQDPPPPHLHQPPSLIIKTLHIPNIYNALQDAASLAEAREIVYHMTETELNQSFYRIFRYWGRVGINLLQGCLRGHGPLAWKTSQIQALLEDPRFRRWRELDGITMSLGPAMDVVFYLDNVLPISKLLLEKYEEVAREVGVAGAQEVARDVGASEDVVCSAGNLLPGGKISPKLLDGTNSHPIPTTTEAPEQEEGRAEKSPSAHNVGGTSQMVGAGRSRTDESYWWRSGGGVPAASSPSSSSSSIAPGKNDTTTVASSTSGGGLVDGGKVNTQKVWPRSPMNSTRAEVEDGLLELRVDHYSGPAQHEDHHGEISMGLEDGSSAMNTIAPGTRERALLSERVAWFNTDSERLTHDAVVLRRSNASSVATSKDAPTATATSKEAPTAPVDVRQTELASADEQAAAPFSPSSLVVVLGGNGSASGLAKEQEQEEEVKVTSASSSSRSSCSASCTDSGEDVASSSQQQQEQEVGSAVRPSASTQVPADTMASSAVVHQFRDRSSSSRSNTDTTAGNEVGASCACSPDQLHPADPPPAPVTGGLSRIRTPAKSSKELPPVKNNQSLQQMNSQSAKVRKGDAPSIARLLAHKDLKGMTAFMLGVRRNHLNFIRFLLQRYKSGKYCNALLRTKNEYAGNETAVMLACRHGLEHAVELMLDCCSEKNRSREQEQGADGLPLGDRAEGSELEDDSALTVREVLNARTTEEKSCFLLACQYNRVQVCKALLCYDHSKHRKFLLKQTDKEKRDALGIAKLYDAHGVVGLLQELE